MSLAKIVNTPGTLTQFKEFVAKYGTADQKDAVKHLKKWRGYERKLVHPAIEVDSDYPTVNYETIDNGDQVQEMLEQSLELEADYIGQAFASWWAADETAVIQVYDRGGKYTAGTSCIRSDAVEKNGSCT